MCGILGGCWLSPSSTLDRQVQDALCLLHTRGPDHQKYVVSGYSNGTLVLGHTRLSIIDLTAAGNQPMNSHDGRYSIVFNGEIYNYKELRQELRNFGYPFTTDSDTEVLLASWIQWGADCLTRLIGMFAFVVHDAQKRTLTCVRDAFGIKPFFYTARAGYFAFASELPALIKLTGVKPTPDWQSAYDYLVHGYYDRGEHTFIENMFHLLPGHLMTVDLNSCLLTKPKRWWQPTINQISTLSFDEAASVLRKLFLESVALHLRSDVPLGVALSGGVDSSAITCAMRHLAPESTIHTFSYIAEGEGLSEEKWVGKVNAHVGATPHKIVVSGEELLKDLNDVIHAQGEPFGSTSIYAQYRVFKQAKESGITVMLDGQGADEILAGYNGYPGARLLSLLEQGKLSDAIRFSSRWGKWPGRRSYTAWMYLADIVLPDAVHSVARRVMGRSAQPLWIDAQFLSKKCVKIKMPRIRTKNSCKGRRVIEQMADQLTRDGIPHLLRHEDRNAMRFSIESRVPFLTIPLVNFLYSLPEEYLISANGETKCIFRSAMRGIIPDELLDRRDKIGFATPEKDWLIGSDQAYKKYLERIELAPILKKQELLNSFDKICHEKSSFGWQAWRWINYSIWYEKFIQH